MLGFGAIGEAPLGGLPDRLLLGLAESARKAPLSVSRLVIPESKAAEGILVRSHSAIWTEIVEQLSSDWVKSESCWIFWFGPRLRATISTTHIA